MPSPFISAPTGRSIRCCRSSPRFTFEVDLARCSVGDPAAFAVLGRWPFRWPSVRRERRQRSWPPAPLAAFMPPIRWAPLSGRLAVSIVLVPWLGTLGSQEAAGRCIAVIGALAMLLPPMLKEDSWQGSALLVFSLCAVGVLTWGMGPVPGDLIAYGRRIATEAGYSAPFSTPAKAATPRSLCRAGRPMAPTSSMSQAKWKRPTSSST